MKITQAVALAIAISVAGVAVAQPSDPGGAGAGSAGAGSAGAGSAGAGSAGAGSAGAGSAGAGSAGAGSAGAGSGNGEVSLPPEHLGGGGPGSNETPGSTPGTAPLVLDALRIGSSDRVELFMFGDTSFIAHTGDQPAFTLGELGLQVTAHLGKGLVGRMESALSYNDQYGTNIDMERVYLEYRINNFVISAGRTHAELGYWNNAFHHGRWLQLTIARPRVLRFEDSGGMVPVHHVGVTVEHEPARGEAGLEVVLAVGNGHGPTLLGIQTNGDDNLAKSLLLRIGGVGYAHDTLRFGVNAMVDKIAADTFTDSTGMVVPVYSLLPGHSMIEVITGAYVALRSEQLIVFSEVYNVLHTGNNQSWDTTDGFIVAGYRIRSLIPYAEFEGRNGDGAKDPFFNPNPQAAPEATAPTSYVEGILGLHYDLNAWSALKFEVGARHLGSGQSGNQGVDTYGDGRALVAGANDFRVEIDWSFGR